MPSTYTTNGGIELPANGEQSGTWGETVNDNMAIIDRLTNGVGAISLSGTTHTLTTADGTLSDGQYNVLVLGGSPSGTNTITISPNDGEHVYVVKNASGQTATFTQGSGANVSVLNNTTKIIYADGAGAGAAVVDITGALDLGSLIIAGTSVTANAAELNILDGVTANAAELNILDGVTANTAELNILDGVTANTAELNILDGVTATAAELNFVDGVTSNVQTQLNTKAPLASPAFTGGIDVTGTVAAGAGTALLPSITTTGDLNTGMWFPAADTIAFSEGGVEALRIDSSGKVGINTTTMQSTFNVQGVDGNIANFSYPTAATELKVVCSTVNVIGIFTGTDDNFVFGTNSTERMRIDSSGNVGIGTSSPSYKLHVSGSQLYLTNSGNTELMTTNTSGGTVTGGIQALSNQSVRVGSITDYPVEMVVDNSVKMTIDSSGDVGIGMTPTNFGNGYTVLQVANASNGGMLYLTNTANAGGRIYGNSAGLTYDAFSTTYHAFNTNGSERARITSDGKFYVNQTVNNGNTAQRMGVTYDGATEWAFAVKTTDATGGNAISFQNSSGTQVGFINQSPSATSYSTSSDYRLKEDIAPMTGALAKVALLKPVTYKWKSDGSDAEGFIAHELAEVCPDAVTGAKDAVAADGNPKYQGIDTSFLVATLTAAIQEQQALITSLTARIAALEST
jgi:hypothetical protein